MTKPHAEEWDRKYDLLLAHAKQNMDKRYPCHVKRPKRLRAGEVSTPERRAHTALHNFYRTYRREYQNEFSGMSKYRRDKLEAIPGFKQIIADSPWKEKREIPQKRKQRDHKAWTKKFEELLEFVSKFGHCYVTFSENPKLYKWIVKQRVDRAKKILPEDRIAKLSGLKGFDWTLKDFRRKKRAREAVSALPSASEATIDAPENGTGDSGSTEPLNQSTHRSKRRRRIVRNDDDDDEMTEENNNTALSAQLLPASSRDPCSDEEADDERDSDDGEESSTDYHRHAPEDYSYEQSHDGETDFPLFGDPSSNSSKHSVDADDGPAPAEDDEQSYEGGTNFPPANDDNSHNYEHSANAEEEQPSSRLNQQEETFKPPEDVGNHTNNEEGIVDTQGSAWALFTKGIYIVRGLMPAHGKRLVDDIEVKVKEAQRFLEQSSAYLPESCPLEDTSQANGSRERQGDASTVRASNVAQPRESMALANNRKTPTRRRIQMPKLFVDGKRFLKPRPPRPWEKEVTFDMNSSSGSEAEGLPYYSSDMEQAETFSGNQAHAFPAGNDETRIPSFVTFSTDPTSETTK